MTFLLIGFLCGKRPPALLKTYNARREFATLREQRTSALSAGNALIQIKDDQIKDEMSRGSESGYAAVMKSLTARVKAAGCSTLEMCPAPSISTRAAPGTASLICLMPAKVASLVPQISRVGRLIPASTGRKS